MIALAQPAAKVAAKPMPKPAEVPGLSYYSAGAAQGLPAHSPKKAQTAGQEALSLMYGYYGAQE